VSATPVILYLALAIASPLGASQTITSKYYQSRPNQKLAPDPLLR
jgi:hypothetical protein